MFTGTTPPEVKVLLQELMGKIPTGEHVFIGCSGNYTTDKVMAGMGFAVHSNDVSLYSKLIADILLGEDTTPMICTDSDLKDVFAQWEETVYKKLCEVMFAMRITGFADCKNDYQKEMYDAFLEQAGIYYHNTIEKLEKGVNFHIEDFYFGDFLGFLKSKAGQGVGITYPPTYKGGYEKLFKFVEKTFEYQHADYDIFDPKTADNAFKELLESDRNIIYSDREFPTLEKWLVGKISLGASKHPIFTYSSVDQEHHYYLERNVNSKDSKIGILPVDYTFTPETKITVQVCSVSDVNYYKAFYMANKVNYSTGGDLGLAFLADGKAFGFASFSKQLSNLSQIFQQSDFVVNSDTKRLSKLLLMLLKTRDIRKIIARATMNYYDALKTTVYTKEPVSMKYRGVFKLDRRDEGKLMYVADFTQQTLGEAYTDWYKKFGGDKQLTLK